MVHGYWEIISKLLRNIIVRHFMFAGKREEYLQFCFYEISYYNYRVMQWDLVMAQVHGQDSKLRVYEVSEFNKFRVYRIPTSLELFSLELLICFNREC